MTRKSAMCRVRWHTFRVARTEDGQRFELCIRCGKDRDGNLAAWTAKRRVLSPSR